jgi:hypothetical protein
VRDALRLMEERERRFAAFDAAIGRGIADIDGGRVHEVRFSDAALKNLRRIGDYIAQDSPLRGGIRPHASHVRHADRR